MTTVSILQRGPTSFRLRTRWTDEATGKIRETNTTVRGSRAYAEAEKRKIMEGFSSGKIEQLSGETVSGYLENWIRHREALGVIRASSAQTYRSVFKTFTDRFGDHSIVSLKVDAVRVWVQDTIAAKGPKLTRYVCTGLKTAFKDAVRDGVLHVNVFDRIQRPKLPAYTKETTISPAKMKELWDSTAAIENTAHRLIVRLALETGLRRGELAGLKWGDINKAGTVTVRRTIVVISREIKVHPPKSESGRRTIGVSSTMRDELNQERGDPEHYVFSGPRPAHPEKVSRLLMKTLRSVGVEAFTAHDFRHAHATHLLRRGLPPTTVSRRLGHSKVTTTLGIYAHAIAEDEAVVINTMEDVLR